MERKNLPGSWALPCGLAFLSSFCVMGVEMAAGRIVAMYVGAGLYTWTSVIGVVLAGITIGNLAGGRLADRFDARRALAVLYLAASLACMALPLVNYWFGRWMAWERPSAGSFPLRVAAHVTAVFLLPSASLGLIGPVVAKLALEGGRSTGRTVGNVYAWGALGSILGTFGAGFWLIAAAGTAGVVLGVAAILGSTALALAPRLNLRILTVAWPLVAGCLAGSFLVAGRGPARWTWVDGRPLLEERGSYAWLYATESQYSFIRITEDRRKKSRTLFMDNLVHSVFSPESPKSLLYEYERIYAIITERQGRPREDLKALFIGGGGYIFPRHIRNEWPRSSIQVAEIDPAVTEANFRAFGLRPEDVVIRRGARLAGEASAEGLAPAGGLGAALSDVPSAPAAAPRPIEVFHLDARNHVEDLLREKREGKGFEPFDFVYGDAFNDYCVPFHLVTREFFEKVRDLLRPGTGVYLMNVIDIYASGRFLGAILNTLRRVFPHVYVLTNTPGGPNAGPSARDTYIVAASFAELDLKDLGKRKGESGFTGAVLDEGQLGVLSARSGGVVLTDDYSPVENLLDVVVRRRAQQ